ncbi:unnamed protein product [Rangifer tarandus platyrhynchus]|uniref:Uncharacterized protein n=2 Tax=Rangifer tarandus platyrhynchus TaxID=3082113 RepID=A0ACB0FBJ8_RANTA|nr:unnamed protein product [Rangifer tarandus platyrhynchus]CAI9710142.1 unnamed protein product [Rangifer tarandus platyrhynchus]
MAFAGRGVGGVARGARSRGRGGACAPRAAERGGRARPSARPAERVRVCVCARVRECVSTRLRGAGVTLQWASPWRPPSGGSAPRLPAPRLRSRVSPSSARVSLSVHPSRVLLFPLPWAGGCRPPRHRCKHPNSLPFAPQSRVLL